MDNKTKTLFSSLNLEGDPSEKVRKILSILL